MRPCGSLRGCCPLTPSKCSVGTQQHRELRTIPAFTYDTADGAADGGATLLKPFPHLTMPPLHTTLELTLPDEAATAALAAQLARLLVGKEPRVTPGGRIHLRGDLGTGKTSLVRALLRAAGITGRIKSPSYTLLESYNISNLYFHHFDFYRFKDAHEWRDAGFAELLDEHAVVLIEWPEQAGTRLPPPDLDIHLAYAGSGRAARLSACSERGQQWLTHLTPPHA